MKCKYKVNVLFLTIWFFIACSTSTEKPQQTVPKKLNTTASTLKQQSFSNKIINLSNQFSKTYNVKEDSIPHRILRNCGYAFFKAFSLKKKHNKNAIQIQFYRFNEISVCDIAQQKLLNNLGDNDKVETGKNMKYIKSNPWYIIRNANTIIAMQYNCENDLPPAIINHVKQQLHQQLATANSKIVNIECGGPLEWL